MVSAKSIWGSVLLGGKLQKDAKNLNFDISEACDESAFYMKTGSMPLEN